MRRFDFESLDSTSTRAAVLARAHPGEPLVVTAGAQTAGRGRNGSRWHAPVGGAWFTLVWPTDLPPARTGAAPIVAGLGVLETLAAACDDASGLRLKWPNDVLLGGRKLAGVLCEQHLAAGSAPRSVLIGVGINANLDPAALGAGAGLRVPATSLRAARGRDVDLHALIDDCAARIAALLPAINPGGLPADLVARVNEKLAWRGQAVTLRQAHGDAHDVLHGIDAQGRARLGGRAFDAGEVTRVDVQPGAPRHGH